MLYWSPQWMHVNRLNVRELLVRTLYSCTHGVPSGRSGTNPVGFDGCFWPPQLWQGQLFTFVVPLHAGQVPTFESFSSIYFA